MKKFGVKPRVFLYNRIMDGVSEVGVFVKWEEWMKMLQLLERMRRGTWDGCLRVWEEMKRDRVGADVMAYATLVTGLCKGGRVEKGYELFREMKVKGFLIDRAIYGVLIEGFVADRKVGAACDLLKDLMDSGL
ncbi:unnamed protein product [Prunus armeniaca]